MRFLVSTLVLMWATFLGTIGRALGFVFGGFLVGFKQGIKDIDKEYRYLKYRKAQIEKKLKEKDDET